MGSNVATEFRGLLDRALAEVTAAETLQSRVAEDEEAAQTLRDVVQQLEADAADAESDKALAGQIGVGRYVLGFFREALERLGKADSSAPIRYYLGCACRSLGQYEDAREHLRKARAGRIERPTLELELLDLDRELGNPAKVATALEKIDDDLKQTADYHYLTGACQADQGAGLGAAEAFQKALELNPQHTGALFRLAWENDRQGNDDEAIELYERCTQQSPVPVGALINLGVLHEDHGDWLPAAMCFGRVAEADPTNTRAQLYLRDARAAENMYYDEEAERKHDRFAQILQTPVSDFELSVRSRNCLQKMNIRDLGDLTRTTEVQLLGSKNFGETSLREIKSMMTAKGLRLGQALEEQTSVVPPPPTGQPTAYAGADEVLNKPIDELHLSVRSRKCMSKLNIRTIGDLVNKTETQLVECKNFGVTSLSEIRSKLSDQGLSLRR